MTKDIAYRFFYILIIPFLLVSCGGSGNNTDTNTLNSEIDTATNNSTAHTATTNSSNPFIFVANPEAGALRTISKPVFTRKAVIQSVIDSTLNRTPRGTIQAKYSVNAYKVEYLTRDASDALIKVSGLIAVPEKTTSSPVLSFQHGTLFFNKEAPSFHLSPENKNPEIALASLGYIVFSPDYIGYGSSSDREHPYLQQQASADVVNDLLRAGKVWLDFKGIHTNTQLFMTGYSQGGYVTMASLKALQESPDLLVELGWEVRGAVMGAGPYDLHRSLEVLSLGITIPSFLVNAVIDQFEANLIDSNADVRFQRVFLERFFANDRQDDVHNWKPDIPIKLFHGEDDRTVPIESAESTFNAMLALGADVELIKCKANPSSHTQCIFPYVKFTVEYFEGLRTDDLE